MKYFAKIKYLGTAFHGFQVQPELRTVQGELNAALNQAFGRHCKVTGCSRTDAGVHANEFCLTVECEGATIPADKLPIAVSRFLPEDLSLFYAEECDESFHPRYDVKEKEYLYRIMNTRIYDPFEYGRVWFLGRPITDEGLRRMNEAAKHFIGKYDFSTFMSEGSDVEDTVRNVTALSVVRNGDFVDVRISADGFLYNMVRIMTGTLIDISRGKIPADSIKQIIAAKNRFAAGYTAPARGLYLNKIHY